MSDGSRTEVNPGALSSRREHAIGVLCGLAVVALFASITVVSRLGFASSLRLIDVAALRFSIGGTLMLPVLMHYGFSGVRWPQAAALTFFGGIGFATFACTGFSLAPSSHGAVLLHGTLPLFTFALSRLTRREVAAPRRAALR